ncbi:MAG: tetratricopeptide repeat protein [Flammeovirgaceae bacterium]|nr:MAG: tetratricopeptide repeat protein [Flammeovirgaceae bacterium]
MKLYINLLLLLCAVLCSTPGVSQKRKRTDTPSLAGVKSREAEFYFTEAEKYFILEDYSKALDYYQKVLEINPENATVHYKIADVLSRGNRTDDMLRASVSIEQALKLERKNKYFYLLGANIYMGLSRHERAAQLFEGMLHEVPNTQEYLYELAVIYQYAGKPEEAIKAYNRAETFFGINETSSLQKQRLYLELGKTKEAITEGEKLLQAFPDEERLATGVAENLSQYNFKTQAITLLEKFTADNAVAPHASMFLAGLYRDTNQEDKARKLLRNVFDDPEVDLTNKLVVLSAYNEELNQLRSKNATDPAKETFALELLAHLKNNYPDEPNVFILGGDLYLAVGKNNEAREEYQKAVQSGEVNFEVWQNLLYIEMQAGNWNAVISHTEKALEYYPNQAMLYYFRGTAFLQRRNYRDAIGTLEQSKKLAAANPAMTAEINSMLGDAYNAVKDYAKSDMAYEDALAFNPNNDVVLNNYSYFLALRKANLERAEKLAAQLIRDHPDNPTYLDTYAWVLYARQKYKEARKVMERFISGGQANATHFEHYGDILFQLGEVATAVKQWEKARQLLQAPSEALNKKIADRKLYE